MRVWLVISSCIQNKFGIQNPEKRETEYTTAICKTLTTVPSEIRVVIVENSGSQPTFLDRLGDVFYSGNGSMNVPNKGIIEFKDLMDTVRHFSIDEDDIVIKLTGRYAVEETCFFERVLSTMNEYDAWLKFFNVCTKEFLPNDCVLGLYAIRVRHLHHLAYTQIGLRNSMEVDFAEFVRMSCSRIDEVCHLGVHCISGDSGGEFRC